MKVLFCGRSLGNFSYHESVIAGLLKKGHVVKLTYDEGRSRKADFGKSLAALASEARNLTIGWGRRREGFSRYPLFTMRALRSLGAYFARPSQSRFYLDRWTRYIPRSLRPLVCSRYGQRILASAYTQSLMARIEAAVPAVRAIKRDIAAFAPDVVVCSPVNLRLSEELESLKAAKKLGIPTVMLVQSWDSMSTKGQIHVAPDLLLAWNAVQEQEAVEFHGLNPQQVVQIGAPFFDKWFPIRHQGTLNRDVFLARVGLNPQRPYLLYLGSSSSIACDESWVVREIVDMLRATGDRFLREVQVLIRPHPGSTRVFGNVLGDGIAMWPREKQLPEDLESQRDFLSSVQHAVLSIGINTSAMIDALIQDAPVAAFISDVYRATQVQALHFQYMRNADCLYELESIAQLPRLIKKVEAGEDDAMCKRRRAFVQTMIRPYGMDYSAGDLGTWCVERLGEGMSPTAVKAALARFLDKSQAKERVA
jgi:hypothetical protein